MGVALYGKVNKELVLTAKQRGHRAQRKKSRAGLVMVTRVSQCFDDC